MAWRYWRARITSFEAVTGTMTTEPGCRTISASRAWPFGSVIDSTCTVKTRPLKTVLTLVGTIGVSMIHHGRV